MPSRRAAAYISVIVLAPWLIGAGTAVRVRGAAKVSAAAFANEDAAVLSGSVVDDTGRPVGNAEQDASA